MKKFIIVFLLINLLSIAFSKNLWDKYLGRMEKFRPPQLNEALLLDILKNRYAENMPGKDSEEENINNKKQTQESFSPEQIKYMIKNGLKDSEGIIRQSALVFLAQKRLKGFSKILINKISKIENVAEKKWFIWAFGEVGSSEDVLALVQYLRNEKNPYVLNLLTVAISKIAQKDGSATPLLILAKHSQNLYVRSSAILGLGKIGDSRALPVIWNMAINHEAKEIRFVSILALSSVMKKTPDLSDRVTQLINRFRIAKSSYEKLALAYTAQKLKGYHEGLYMYLLKMLKDPYFNEVAIDLLEEIPYRQGKPRLEMVVLAYPRGAVKQRIENLVMKIRRRPFRR